MLEKFRTYLLMISFLVIAGGLMLYIYVLAKGDGEAFGGIKGTLQPTDFTSLTYAVGDSGYLMCSLSLCAAADADADAEPFNLSASKLRQILADYADTSPAVSIHDFDFRNNQYDFVERLPGQTFPNVISVRVIANTDYTSRLAYYSYRPVGSSDAEDHRQNAARWIAELHSIAKDQ